MAERDLPAFHRIDYAATYPAFGEVVDGGDVPIHRRPIDRTDYCDGALPWPYVWLDGDGVDRLRLRCADLVTVTGVLAPSEHVPLLPVDVQPFKDHYMFDPRAASVVLSHKSRANLRRGQRVWTPAPAVDDAAWAAATALYRSLVERRGLAGTPFDLPVAHFDVLRAVAGITLLGVCDRSGEWGSMAIAAEGVGGTHLLHIVNSDAGLRQHASYVLMYHLVEEHTRLGRCLYLGGVPQRDTDGGVARFKRRWSNRTMSSWLLTLVFRPDVYTDLTRDLAPTGFFPAYRSPWS